MFEPNFMVLKDRSLKCCQFIFIIPLNYGTSPIGEGRGLSFPISPEFFIPGLVEADSVIFRKKVSDSLYYHLGKRSEIRSNKLKLPSPEAVLCQV